VKVESKRYLRAVSVSVNSTSQKNMWICRSNWKSQPRKVNRFDDGEWNCDCPDFGKPEVMYCKHIIAVAKRLKIKMVVIGDQTEA
jgi:hypothetical protein